jgi:predicted phage terminase large subunit-like protein
LPHGPTYPENIERKFVGSKVEDNPHLDLEAYLKSLAVMAEGGSELTYEQLRHGDWTAMGSGGYFHPENFRLCPWFEVPDAWEFRNIIRYWDFGSTEKTEDSPDPDWTVGLKIGITKKGSGPLSLPDYYVLDVARTRGSPGAVQQLVVETAKRDGVGIPQWLEQERGSAGKHFVWTYNTVYLPGYRVRGLYVTGDKETRAKQAAARVDEGRVYLVEGDWIPDFKAEAGAFPVGEHDDQVDALSHGMRALEREHLMADGGVVEKRGKEQRPSKRGKQEPRPFVGWA